MPSDKSEREKTIDEICTKLGGAHSEVITWAIRNLPTGYFPDEDKPKADINGVILNK